MATALGARVKPTKGFLLQLKKRVGFVEEGYKLLELKRDELANELRASLDVLGAKRRELEERVERSLRNLGRAYASLGSNEMRSQTKAVEKSLEIDVLPRSVMGIVVPYLKVQSEPSVINKFGPIVRSVAREFRELMEGLLRVAELESRIERIADDLEKTNRKVNALEKIVIPEYKRVIKQIEDRLDEDLLEEFIRTKFVRSIISERRA
ncbi:TPA: V-type ATP synthase subunit D [Candidatus Bathyarchaeota archaeon]|nr:V-type ATP synthase subunit D [Candidatus Bathyarchaeota archaeon]